MIGISNLFKNVQLRIKQYFYNKVAEEEKALDVLDAIEQARESMQTLRETIIRVYEYNTMDTNDT